MKVLIVLCAVVAVSLAGFVPGGFGGYAAPGPVAVESDAASVAEQNAIAEAQGAFAAAQGAAAAAAGSAAIAPGPGVYAAPAARYSGPIAPVVLTAQGVPVDTPEVQAARAADAAAHLAAKQAALG